MKRVLLSAVVFLGLVSVVSAQAGAEDTFYFDNDLVDIKDLAINPNFISKHYLGEDIAVKMHLLKETYTYIERGDDLNPVDKTVVNKPTIFYSMKKLNNYYKKQIKKGTISKEDAKEKLDLYLDICLSIYLQSTDNFEEALRTSKGNDEIVGVFSRVILK
ncbi:hypothetical protein ACFLU5_10905 [Bacteroidota bacterium]